MTLHPIPLVPCHTRLETSTAVEYHDAQGGTPRETTGGLRHGYALAHTDAR